MDKYDKADFDGAIVDFSQAIQLKPDYVQAYMGRAMAYKGLGDLENQITELRKAAELLQKQGDTDTEIYQAILDLIKATQDLIDQLNPNSKLAFAQFFLNKGIEDLKKGDFGQAIAGFNLVIRLNPNDARAYLFRGNAYGQLKEYQKAIADYTQAIRLNPNYADAYNLRGLFYIILGDSQKAALLDFV